MIRQSDKLREFFEGDTKALILFDGQRYDFFENMCQEYLGGKLYKAYNGGATWTLPWFIKYFQGKINCTLYSANPAFSGGQGYLTKWFSELKAYEPSKHFKRIIPWWEVSFDYARGTATPKAVNRAVFAKPDDKMIIHYLQPHVPFIGNPPLPWTKGGLLIEKTKSKLVSGELTIEKLKEAYKGNMRVAFEGAVELVNKLGGNVCITSDHGDALGEQGYFYHGREYPKLDCLCHVPWFEIEGLSK